MGRLWTSMVDKRVDRRETEELKNIYNQYLDKRKEFITNTRLKVEDIFGDVISKVSISPEEVTKHNNFLSKIL